MSTIDNFIESDMLCDAMGYSDDMTDTERLSEQGWFDDDIGLLMGDEGDY